MSAKTVVAATDGSGESPRAVERAALRGVPLRIVSAASLPEMVVLGLQPAGRSRLARAAGRHRLGRGRFPPPGLNVAGSAAARRLTALMDMWREKYPEVPASEDVVQAHPGRWPTCRPPPTW